MKVLKNIWRFLGQYQTKAVRLYHILILSLVLTQILISNWMKVSVNDSIPIGYRFFTYLHIIIGFSLLFLTIRFIFICLKQRGWSYYYPYLIGDFKQVSQDIKTLFKFKLPDSNPRGLAPIIQGLGLGALSIAIFSGASWFIMWLNGFNSLAISFLSYHKILVGLIEIYIVGHGTMAILHFAKWLYQR